jgi:hypothetical protein
MTAAEGDEFRGDEGHRPVEIVLDRQDLDELIARWEEPV